MKVRYSRLVCAVVLFGMPLAGMSRDTDKPVVVVDGSVAGEANFVSEQIKTLAAMSGPERRAAMTKMSAEERRGLWFQAKRYQVDQRKAARGDVKKAVKGQKVPVSAEPGNNWKRAKIVGTIAYDSGLPSVGFGSGSPNLPGNRFNTHTGLPVLASGTVSTVQALVVPGPAQTSSSAGFVMHGPETTMGGALAVFSTFAPATGVVDSVTFAGMGASYTGSSFFVMFGDFASSYIPVFGTGTTLGQGHHAVVGNTGMMGPNVTAISPLSTLNGFIRATGNIVPVELMNFSVE